MPRRSSTGQRSGCSEARRKGRFFAAPSAVQKRKRIRYDRVPPALRGPDGLGDLSPTPGAPEDLPAVASLPEATSCLNEQDLMALIDEVG